MFEKIGEGTFSKVYRGQALHGDRAVVALKRLTPCSTGRRFLNEVVALHKLGGQHHVISIIDGLRVGHHFTMILPYFEHQHFKDYFQKMTLKPTQEYMKALFESLAHLHSHGVIHRDIKPSNFLHSFGTDRYMLIDFGLAQYDPQSDIFDQHFTAEDPDEEKPTQSTIRSDDL